MMRKTSAAAMLAHWVRGLRSRVVPGAGVKEITRSPREDAGLGLAGQEAPEPDEERVEEPGGGAGQDRLEQHPPEEGGARGGLGRGGEAGEKQGPDAERRGGGPDQG